ncbi:helix-hairpin-helix domain-containing protein [Sulfurovum sp. NBC37-1]|uniref:helix-hairpin-helix domain-containing protein n=1 Tax=Sulfurovum sp. (strain NBC37-1) TaxID=387093 RepID=UPI000158785E|nr:Tex family protein [Sulfurovum sp. NBC37-1]BAF71681.1 transcription accessory protein [Sulfurovum sp. NBC37-1]
MQNLTVLLVKKTTLNQNQIKNILMLLDKGDTIPFIARYRKELTGGADDDQLRVFHDVYLSAKRLLERKEGILHILKEREQLGSTLKNSIENAETMTALEDIYRPYKEKKNTRAATAMKQGLEPLANILQSAKLSKEAFMSEAKRFVRGEVKDVAHAIKGAQDIVAERYAEQPKEREVLRQMVQRHGNIEVKATKHFTENGSFKNYKAHTEKIAYIPSHRYLAIKRGEKEKELSVKLSIDTERYLETLKRYKLRDYMGSSKTLLLEAYKDGFKRLLYPSIEREVFALLKEKSDAAAIGVFGKNMAQLFMTPPVTGKVLMGVDPAYRTGCKLAVIDENGKYLDHAVIYPVPPRDEYDKSRDVVVKLVKKYNIQGAAIGNGTASNETQAFFAKLNSDGVTIPYTVVSEAGASVYSASAIAAREYPDLDVTIRGAISIAGRVRDPMATLVKIDPKSLGIGQYQHDVDQKLLERKLHEGVESLVNAVGVDVNSASASLLSYVAGLGMKVAENIVKHRESEGTFDSKKAVLKVKGLGAKAYEQAAGFLRIREGKSIFDNSGIHPESYAVAKALEKYDDLSDTRQIAEELKVGEPTLLDIIKELAKPGFDPREELPSIPFKQGLTDINALREGSIVSGVVRNIADFGAFVDIGLKNDGMIHISQMSQKRIKHPLEVLSVNQYLPRVEVISIDLEKNKVGLSLKDV